jgi:iron complex transport system permease protein
MMAALKERRISLRTPAMVGAALLLLAGACLVSLRFGSMPYSTGEIIKALFADAQSQIAIVIWQIRLPRTLIALMVGANLSISGALLQAVLGNPLADPGLIGVSSGGSLAALVIMLVFPELSSLVPAVAFLGGMAACVMIFGLAWRKGSDPVRIVLAGVAVNAILGGGTAVLSILYSDRIQGVLMWLNGSIAGKSWHQVETLFPYTVTGLIGAALLIKQANLLRFGDEVAQNLGMRVNWGRLLLTAVAAFNAGICVAIVGLIGFVGLIVPHISRMLVGSDYRRMLPMAAIFGSALLIFADAAARTVFSPIELPVGVIMAVSGGPFFLYLMRKGEAKKG